MGHRHGSDSCEQHSFEVGSVGQTRCSSALSSSHKSAVFYREMSTKRMPRSFSIRNWSEVNMGSTLAIKFYLIVLYLCPTHQPPGFSRGRLSHKMVWLISLRNVFLRSLQCKNKNIHETTKANPCSPLAVTGRNLIATKDGLLNP